MGRPKQLLPIASRPLLRHVVEASIGASVAPVIVVIGANADEIRPCLNGLPVQIVVNENWTAGMGASVRAGLQALASLSPKATGVIIALADQPRLSTGHLSRLLNLHRRTGQSIVASQFGGKSMPPVYFAAKYFPELLALQGDSGARSLLLIHAEEVATVPVEDLGDLDSPADYTEYLQHEIDAKSPPTTSTTECQRKFVG
jgi:molybdenum cofactor cytidylyltransferase